MLPQKQKPRRVGGVSRNSAFVFVFLSFLSLVVQFSLRRLANAVPAKPTPSRSQVEGSGAVAMVKLSPRGVCIRA